MTAAAFVVLVVALFPHYATGSIGFMRPVNGDLHYYDDERYLSFIDADELCKSLGGRIPSVHSEKDVHFLSNLIPHGASIWLAGRKIKQSPPTYEWTDGTTFDYDVWDPKLVPNCDEDCCGIAMRADVSHSMQIFDCGCNQTHLPVCRITMSPTSLAQKVRSVALKVQDLDQQMQSFLTFTHLASGNISEYIAKVREDERRTREKIVEMVNFLNTTAPVYGYEKQLPLIVQPSKQQSEPASAGLNKSSKQQSVGSIVVANSVSIVIVAGAIVFLLSVFLYKYVNS